MEKIQKGKTRTNEFVTIFIFVLIKNYRLLLLC